MVIALKTSTTTAITYTNCCGAFFIMENKYIHPNFKPTDKNKYLELVNRLREMCWNTQLTQIEVSQEEYNILEDASHSSMKGKGHQVYGVEVIVRKT